MFDIKNDPRFTGLEPLTDKVWLSSPTMHGDEEKWVRDAIRTNWVSTVGANIDEIEHIISEMIGVRYAVGLSTGTASLHMAVKLAGRELYGTPEPGHGYLEGRKVFASDMTFAATVNPVTYEGGIPVFIDTDRETWNMDPVSLEKAFELYPEVKLVVMAHLYGVPGRIDELKSICDRHGAILIEDAAESLGATYRGVQTGSFGKYGCISFNGNKIITGSAGGMLLTDCRESMERVRKWSTQSREKAPWYQHEELGYNYRISNIIAGIVRGQLPYLKEHIAQKKAIYERYKEGFRDLPVSMNPFDPSVCEPNYWLSCLIIDEGAMTDCSRTDSEGTWKSESGRSCPDEILAAISAVNAEGRPIWKPMHLQPIYSKHPFVSANAEDAGADIFRRGLCLPSDNKMTPEQQDRVIEAVRRCFS